MFRTLFGIQQRQAKGTQTRLGPSSKSICRQDALFIRGDEFRLMQVMANLLSNALKFSQNRGAVLISAEKVGHKVRISVADKGVGIPENSKELVFGQFTQVDSSDQRKVGGTGLGMSITRKIVEGQNGEIDYVSTFGHGSTFFVEFPSVSSDKDQLNRIDG